MRTDKQEQHARETQDKIKKYEFALKAFVALEHKFSSLAKVNIYQAKKLRLGDTKPALRDREVTPDMVVETNDSGILYRAIVEIKESLTTLPENWDALHAQLEKYRLATSGWDNAVPDARHDVMLVASMRHAKKVVAWARKKRGGSGMGRWLIVVGIVVTKHEDNEWMEIAKVYGKIGHPKIDRELSPERDCRILLDDIVKKLARMKFYDSYPPVEYTMSILWDHVFSKFVHGKKLKQFRNDKKVSITITMTQILDKIATFAPRTNPKCIRRSWIREAMSMFVKMRIVSHEGNEQFTIAYKKHKKPTTDWIADRVANLSRTSTGTGASASARRTRALQGNTSMDDFT